MKTPNLAYSAQPAKRELDHVDRALIERTLKAFDFEKVAAAMKAVGWTWGDRSAGYFPTVAELVAFARRLLETAMRQQGGWAGSGGFTAWFDRSEDEPLGLYFTLESSCAEPDDPLIEDPSLEIERLDECLRSHPELAHFRDGTGPIAPAKVVDCAVYLLTLPGVIAMLRDLKSQTKPHGPR